MSREIAGSDTLIRHIGRKVASIPLAGAALSSLWHGSLGRQPIFRSSAYGQARNGQADSRGAQSCGRLTLFKAEIINRFVKDNDIADVIELGCGDWAQLSLASYPRYVGIDMSSRVVASFRKMFCGDPTKTFLEEGSVESDAATAQMAMSLDLIYYLVQDDLYEAHMRRLERSAGRFICIYSSNVELPGHVRHIRHRCFTDWFARHAPQWALSHYVRNRYSYQAANPADTSWSDFYFFERGPTAITIPFPLQTRQSIRSGEASVSKR